MLALGSHHFALDRRLASLVGLPLILQLLLSAACLLSVRAPVACMVHRCGRSGRRAQATVLGFRPAVGLFAPAISSNPVSPSLHLACSQCVRFRPLSSRSCLWVAVCRYDPMPGVSGSIRDAKSGGGGSSGDGEGGSSRAGRTLTCASCSAGCSSAQRSMPASLHAACLRALAP